MKCQSCDKEAECRCSLCGRKFCQKCLEQFGHQCPSCECKMFSRPEE